MNLFKIKFSIKIRRCKQKLFGYIDVNEKNNFDITNVRNI